MKRGSEPRCEVAGLRLRLLPTRVEVRGQQAGLEADIGDIGQPDEAQPVIEEGRMVVAAEGGRDAGGVHAARVDGDSLFPLASQQAAVAGRWVEAKEQAGLGDYVNVVFEDLRNAPVPHWDAEQIAVGGGEPVGDIRNGLPGGPFSPGGRDASHDGHLCGGLVAVEDGQRFGPQVKGVYGGIRVGGAVGGQEGISDVQRIGAGATR